MKTFRTTGYPLNTYNSFTRNRNFITSINYRWFQMNIQPLSWLIKRPVIAGTLVFSILLAAASVFIYQNKLLHKTNPGRHADLFVFAFLLLAVLGGIFTWYICQQPLKLKKIAEEQTALFSEQLSEKENLLRIFIEHSPASLAMFDKDMNYINVSSSWTTEYNLGARQLIGKNHYEVFPGIPQRWKDIHQRCLAGAIEKSDEDSFVRQDGTVDWLKWEIHPWHKASGEIGGIIMLTEVITGRKNNEAIILHEKNLSETIINGLPGIFYVADKNGKMIRWNRNLETITGYDFDQISKMHTTDFVNQAQLEFIYDIRQEAFLSGRTGGEIEIITRQGERLSYYITIMSIQYNNEPCILGIGIDFTETKEATLALAKMNRENKERAKELKCLYKLSELAAEKKYSLDEIMKECVNVIPPAYQYPEITCAQIVFGDEEYMSDGFRKSDWKQEAFISLKGVRVGKIIVYYTEEKPVEREGPFLAEERFLINSISDILGNLAERKLSENEVQKLSRLYQFTSSINEMILKAADKETIFAEACQIAIQQGKSRMAWVGTIDLNEQKVVPISFAGFDDGYLQHLATSDNKKEWSQGPVGKAIQNRTFYCCNDIANDPGMEHLREAALKRGYRSSISMPVIVNAQLQAVYTLYMSEPFFFNDAEIKLLNEVTDNIAYALDKIRLRDLQISSEEELRESEEKFRKLVEESLVGVFIIQEGKFKYVNPRFEKICGYSNKQLLKEISFEQLVHKDDSQLVWKNHLARMGGDNPTDHYVLKAVKKDGNIVYIEIIVSKINYKGNPAIIGSVVDITIQVEEEKRINKAVTEAQENERQQISMELHDNVKQIMAASLMNLDYVKLNANNKPLVTETIGKVQGYIRQSVDELRRISHRLAPSVDTDLPFPEKIRTLVNTMNVADKLDITLNFANIKSLINNDIQLAFYRIVQEQFTNILKYAGASSVSVSLKKQQGDLVMSISDDGKGFDLSTKKSGIGLENMKRRAQILNGNMTITTAPGKGCDVTIRVPVNE